MNLLIILFSTYFFSTSANAASCLQLLNNHTQNTNHLETSLIQYPKTHRYGRSKLRSEIFYNNGTIRNGDLVYPESTAMPEGRVVGINLNNGDISVKNIDETSLVRVMKYRIHQLGHKHTSSSYDFKVDDLVYPESNAMPEGRVVGINPINGDVSVKNTDGTSRIRIRQFRPVELGHEFTPSIHGFKVGDLVYPDSSAIPEARVVGINPINGDVSVKNTDETSLVRIRQFRPSSL